MAKDPAMLFYAADFLTGSALLSMKERGQYITLLCLQQQLGHMTLSEMQRAVGKLTPLLKGKFIEDGEGKLYNRRADIEIAKRVAHCDRQKSNVAKRWNKPNDIPDTASGIYHGITTVIPLENEDEIYKTKLEEQSNDLGELERESERKPTKDPALGEVMTAYMDKLGTLSTTACAELLELYKLMGRDVLLHALNVAIDNGALKYSYIKGILRDYRRNGLDTLDKIINSEREYAAAKERGKGGSNGQYQQHNKPTSGKRYDIKYDINGNE